jgi:hypothetical protein
VSDLGASSKKATIDFEKTARLKPRGKLVPRRAPCIAGRVSFQCSAYAGDGGLIG